MKIPFSKKELVVREIEVKDESELTEEEKEELEVKKAKKGLVKTVLLATATFAGGVAAGAKGYKEYMSHKNDDDGIITIHSNDPDVANAAFDAALDVLNSKEEKAEEESEEN